MKKYKCIRNFKSENGKEYNYGDILDVSDYHNLINSDRSYFSEHEEDSNFTMPGDILGTGIPGGIDMDFTTPF